MFFGDGLRFFFLSGALVFVGLFFHGFDVGASLGHEDFALLLGEDECAVGVRRLQWLRWIELSFVEEALEFGGEAEAGEFVGHPDVGVAVAGLFDAGAEVAGGDDLTGGGANDAGEEMVHFVQAQGDAVGAGLLECLDAGHDAFPAHQAASAGGGDMPVFDAVYVQVSLSGFSPRSDFAGEGFVTRVG
jgi:hypothetical protein